MVIKTQMIEATTLSIMSTSLMTLSSQSASLVDLENPNMQLILACLVVSFFTLDMKSGPELFLPGTQTTWNLNHNVFSFNINSLGLSMSARLLSLRRPRSGLWSTATISFSHPRIKCFAFWILSKWMTFNPKAKECPSCPDAWMFLMFRMFHISTMLTYQLTDFQP